MSNPSPILAQYAHNLHALLEVTRQVADSANPPAAVEALLSMACRLSGAGGARLVLAQPDLFGASPAAGPLAEAMAPGDRPVAERVFERPARQGFIALGAGDPALPAGVAGAVAFPVTARGSDVGVLWLGAAVDDPALADALPALEILAAQIGVVVGYAQAIHEARSGRRWLAAIVTSTPDPVIVIDRQQVIRLLNPPAEALLGAERGGAVGAPVSEIAGEDALGEALRALGQGDPLPPQVVSADGRTFAPSLAAIDGEEDGPGGWVLILRDMTHFKRLNRSMSEFLSTVSHDMRSPLTFMKGYLDMLGMIGPLNERQTEFVEKIAGGVTQMADMVEKILDAGKLDPVTGTYELAREPADIAELAHSAAQSQVEAARKKGLTLLAAIADDLPILNVDRNMLSSAFTNLVENAVKYTPQGGTVEVSLDMEPGAIVFCVRDNGYGIPLADQARLFERNVRLHRPEWKRVKGSGLGLFIVKNVAQRHGGDAWVESVEGQGSAFYISIPLDGANLLAESG